MPSDVKIVSAMPLQANDGSVTMLSVEIGQTQTTKQKYSIYLCPVTNGMTLSDDIRFLSTELIVYKDVSIAPGVTGDFALYLQDATNKLYDTKLHFTVSSASDTDYSSCGLLLPRASVNNNVACDFVPLTYDVTKQVFGKGIADRFLVVQVTVRNLNRNLEYLFQDVRLGTAELEMGSVDKKIARGVSEKTGQYSARAISFRLTEAGAAALSGIAGVVANGLLTSVSSLVGGQITSALHTALPVLSTQELARLDDLGFSTTSTVVPKNSSIPIVAFLSFRSQYTVKDFKNLQKEELKRYWKSLDVRIAGIHVQQADLGKPTIKSIVQKPTSIVAETTKADISIVVAGSGFSSVASILLQSKDATEKALPALLKPLADQTAVDDNTAQIVIPAGTTLKAESYEIILVTKDGSKNPTGKAIDATAPPGAAANQGGSANGNAAPDTINATPPPVPGPAAPVVKAEPVNPAKVTPKRNH